MGRDIIVVGRLYREDRGTGDVEITGVGENSGVLFHLFYTLITMGKSISRSV